LLTVTGSAPLALLDVVGTFSIASDQRSAFDIHGALPLTSAAEHVDEGSVRARIAWIDAGASWFLLPKRRWVCPYVGARTGLLLLSSDATPSTGGRDQRTDGAFFGAVATGVSLRLVPNVRLKVEAGIGFTTPELLLQVAQTVVDRLGPPLFQFGVGAEVGP
jgi:hypothetical protein